MTKEEFQKVVEIAEQDQAFNGYKKTANDYVLLLLQCYEVYKRC